MKHVLILTLLVMGICQPATVAAENEGTSDPGTGTGDLPPGFTIKPNTESDVRMIRARRKRAEEEGRGWSAGVKSLPLAIVRSDGTIGPDFPDGLTMNDWIKMSAQEWHEAVEKARKLKQEQISSHTIEGRSPLSGDPLDSSAGKGENSTNETEEPTSKDQNENKSNQSTGISSSSDPSRPDAHQSFFSWIVIGLVAIAGLGIAIILAVRNRSAQSPSMSTRESSH